MPEPRQNVERLMALFLVVVIGLVVGVFLNECVERLPKQESLLDSRRVCAQCGRAVDPWELFPMIEFVAGRGRCRQCGARVPVRGVLVELGAGLLFALVWLRFGFSWETVVAALYASLFLMILFIDLEHRVIPNNLVYPAVVVAIVVAPFWPGLDLPRALIGGVVGFCLMLIPGVFGGMGGGDVKLAGLIGIMVGFPLIFVALIIAVILGGVMACLLLLLRKKGRKDAIAYGPYLAVAGFVTLLYGQNILLWYLGRFAG